MRRLPAVRWLARGLGIAGVLLAVVTVRVVTESRSELDEGDRRAEAGEPDAAVVHYRRAAGWHAPGNPYCAGALEKLATMASDAEEAGDTRRALATRRAMRAGILSGRSFYTPHSDRLGEVDDAIASAMALLERQSSGSGLSREQLREEHLQMLNERPGPDILWLVVLWLGFAAWVGGAFAFARSAFDGEDRLVGAPARIWGTVIIVGLGLWVLGMTAA